MALTGPSHHATMIGVMYITDLAVRAPFRNPPSTVGAVVLLLVGAGVLCGGIVIATDYKKAAFRLYAKAIRIYGGTPAEPLSFRVGGLLAILGGSGAVSAGIYWLSR